MVCLVFEADRIDVTIMSQSYSATNWQLFLLHCDYYDHIRAAYLPKFKLIQTNFMALPNADKLRHILGENSKTIATAARYVSACHKLRLSASGQTRSTIISFMLYLV